MKKQSYNFGVKQKYHDELVMLDKSVSEIPEKENSAELQNFLNTKDDVYSAIAFIKHDTMRVAKQWYQKPQESQIRKIQPEEKGKETQQEKIGQKRVKRVKVDSQAVINALAMYKSEEAVREEFSLSDGQLRAIKAHQTMGTYTPVVKVNYFGAVFEGEGDQHKVFSLIERLNKRYDGIDNIPDIQYKHHRLKRVE
ncbi:hypothetical protein HZA96_07330 [Candidatus Woesearchaeota archaeon]|nr:hypothetical protein [Candidatus Woesearchaeota archaeon]